MWKRKLLINALMGAGFISALVFDARQAARPDNPSLLLATIGMPFCAPPRSGPPHKTFFRLAVAQAESAKERALIAALTARYRRDAQADRAALDQAYAAAMQEVAASYPDDNEIALLYAESLMDLQPWDYWQAAGTLPKGRTEEIVGLLEKVLARAPDHAGAIHYYIHLTEEANRQAVLADEAYIARSMPAGIYPQAYYPHNVHSLMVSAHRRVNREEDGYDYSDQSSRS